MDISLGTITNIHLFHFRPWRIFYRNARQAAVTARTAATTAATVATRTRRDPARDI